MAKFRTNHDFKKRKGNSFVFRIILFIFFLFAALYFLYDKLDGTFDDTNESYSYQIPEGATGDKRYYLPIGKEGELVHHKHFSLSYNESNEQADWVAYELTKKMLKLPNLPRHDHFAADYDVKTRTAFHSDYTHSGYTRGHLVPAADMSWDKKAQEETFYMSNISPQLSAFNGGIWNELEQAVRDWAYDNDRIFITSGPLFLGNTNKKIGKKNRIKVPSHFFKAVMDTDGKEQKGIAFVIPHEKSESHLSSYALSIDSLESISGLDLFSGLLSDKSESNIELTFDIESWRIENSRFRKRVDNWNNR